MASISLQQSANIYMALALLGIIILVAVFVLFGTFVQRKNKLIRTKLEAELQHQKRLHQSELKALRGQMNPHFLHNSINAIQYYIQRNEVDISEHYLSKFSKLLRLFFEYSRRQYVTLEEEEELLTHYLEIEQLRFEDKLDFSIGIDPKIDLEEVRLPAMMLQPLVENAVNHGIFHKQGKGYVSIQFTYINELTYEVRIEDNGIGFKMAKTLKQNQNDKVKAHSSNVLEERISLLNASSQWKVSFTMTDKSDLGNETGTLINLSLEEIVS